MGTAIGFTGERGSLASASQPATMSDPRVVAPSHRRVAGVQPTPAYLRLSAAEPGSPRATGSTATS
jgi:hypothetical protein